MALSFCIYYHSFLFIVMRAAHANNNKCIPPTTHTYTQSLHYAMTKVSVVWWKQSNLRSWQRRERQEIFTEWTHSSYRSSAVWRETSCRRDIPILWSVCPSGVWIGLPPGTPSGQFALEEKYLSPFWALCASGQIYVYTQYEISSMRRVSMGNE